MLFGTYIANRAREQTIMMEQKEKRKLTCFLRCLTQNPMTHLVFTRLEKSSEWIFFFLVTQNELVMKMLDSYRYDGYVGVFQPSI